VPDELISTHKTCCLKAKPQVGEIEKW